MDFRETLRANLNDRHQAELTRHDRLQTRAASFGTYLGLLSGAGYLILDDVLKQSGASEGRWTGMGRMAMLVVACVLVVAVAAATTYLFRFYRKSASTAHLPNPLSVKQYYEDVLEIALDATGSPEELEAVVSADILAFECANLAEVAQANALRNDEAAGLLEQVSVFVGASLVALFLLAILGVVL